MPRTFGWIGMVVLLAVCTVGAFADALKEGRELYKAGKYAQAVEKLEQATREDPNNPKAWWQLNFAYNKLERYADALRAVENAGRLDPSHGFASEAGKYRETVARLRKKAGSGGRQDPLGRPLLGNGSRSAQPAEPPLNNSMVTQLTSRGMYLEAGIAVDARRLEAVIRELRPVQIRFLVFNSRAGSSSLSRESDRVRNYLGIADGYVIACSKAGVAVSSKALNRDTLRDLTRQVAPQMETGDYTGALERLARALAATRQAQVVRTRTTGALAVGGIGALVVGWVIARRIRNKRAMKERRSLVEQSKSEIISQMNYLEDSAGAAPPAMASAVKQARLEAGTKLDEASRIIVRAQSEYDLTRAQRLLDEASEAVARGRDALEGRIVARQEARPPIDGLPPVYGAAAPGSGPDTDWDAVPEDRRGVCFFCARPSLLAELTPVTVDLDGQTQRVLACREDLRVIKTGESPRIRAFDRGGRVVPWYADDSYDPYRDYYGRGYGDRSLLTDLVMLHMVDRMFWDWNRPTWGWGGGHGSHWDGYTFWPDHHHWHDHQVERAASRSFDRDESIDAAGTDFLGAGMESDSSDGAGIDFLGRDDS